MCMFYRTQASQPEHALKKVELDESQITVLKDMQPKDTVLPPDQVHSASHRYTLLDFLTYYINKNIISMR